MGISAEFTKDLYNGMKSEFKRSPWTVTSVLCMWAVAWAVYFFVYPELASATNVAGVQADVKEIRKSLLDKEIIAILTQRCRTASKGFLTARLSVLLQEYEQQTGKPYPQPLPSCEDLN